MGRTVNDEDGQPWDFDDPHQRNKATRKLLTEEPGLLVGSPMCTRFCAWQRLNVAKSSNPEWYAEERRKAVRHLEFVSKLYKIQWDAGRLFLHEHPQQADSWEEPCMRRLLSLLGVDKVEMDQCQLGQQDS